MYREANKKRTPLVMILVLSSIAMPFALKSFGVPVNFHCLASAAFHFWGSTMKTVGNLYQPSIASDFASFSNSFADEQLNDRCPESLVCRNEPPVEIEIAPDAAMPVVIQEEIIKPKYPKPLSRVVAPKQHFEVMVNSAPVAMTITPEPVQLQLTPVAYRNFVRVKDLRKPAVLTNALAQAEVWKNYSVREDEIKRKVEQFKASCNFAALHSLQEKERFFKVVVKINTPAPEKEEFRVMREVEVSEL